MTLIAYSFSLETIYVHTNGTTCQLIKLLNVLLCSLQIITEQFSLFDSLNFKV